MAKRCAYCGRQKKLTREHIWPACIIKRVLSYDARYSEQARKFFRSDLVISDICGDCNGGVLSSLDTYICQMYDKYFCQFPRLGDVIQFGYDYQKLTRWLLKISYNSARTTGKNVKTLRQYVPYITGQEQSIPNTFSVRLELIAPITIEVTTPSGVIYPKELFPASTRCCRIQFPSQNIDWCVIRLVAINSYYFWLVFTPEEAQQRLVDIEELQSVANSLPSTILEPDSDKVVLNVSQRHTIDMHKDWVNLQRDKFELFRQQEMRGKDN